MPNFYFKKYVFTFILITAVAMLGKSQSLSTYQFTSKTSTFNLISGGTLLGKTTASTGNIPSLDKAVYNLTSGTIPFSFKYENNFYTGMYVSSNGFITFGTLSPNYMKPLMLLNFVTAMWEQAFQHQQLELKCK